MTSHNMAVNTYFEQWRIRWPEWETAEIFVPLQQRQLAFAWFALLQEFDDAFHLSGDPLPADAKLHWWQQELHNWADGRTSHPLARLLESTPAPWASLADALPSLITARTQPSDSETAFTRLQSYAHAIALIEQAIFTDSAQLVDTAALINAQTLTNQWLITGLVAIPKQIQHENTADANKAWVKYLLSQWPKKAIGTRPRRLWASIVHARLRQYPNTYSASRWGTLWRAWRAASSG